MTSATSSFTLGSSQNSESVSTTLTGASESPSSIQDVTFVGFSVSNITVTIDGTQYHPPLLGQDPLVIILSDSTTAKITESAIIRDSVSLPFPSYQELSQDSGSSIQQLSSWSVRFDTRLFQPSSCSLNILGCFRQAVADFTSVASDLGDALASIGATMMQAGIVHAATAVGYASDASSYSVTVSSLLDGMSTALSSLERAAEALDGAMQAVNDHLSSFTSVELEELTEAGRLFSSYPEVSLARGMLSNLSKMMKLAWGSSHNVIQSLWSLCQAQWLPITSGGALVTSVWVLHDVGNVEHGERGEQLPEEERLHFILFEQGFPITVFDVWTFVLDSNKGTKTAADASVNDDLRRRGLEPAYGPGYTTEITIPMATLIRLLPFVRVVYLHPTFEQKKKWGTLLDSIEERNERNDKQNHPFPRGFAATRKRDLEEGQAQMNLAAFSHYKGATPDWTYTRDSSGGDGVTIFVPDSGAAIDGPFWQASQKA